MRPIPIVYKEHLQDKENECSDSAERISIWLSLESGNAVAFAVPAATQMVLSPTDEGSAFQPHSLFAFLKRRYHYVYSLGYFGTHYVDQTGLKFTEACLYLPSAGFTGVNHHMRLLIISFLSYL